MKYPLPLAQVPLVGQGPLIMEASRSHSGELPWTSDWPIAETSAWHHTKSTSNRHPCPWPESNPQSQQASGRRPTP